ncbi:WXG100 family type VII secretion target [Streptomyces sp. NPDC057052]|uniref:WXG100 family type VII secretion target n=1 Tax=Streptomyces sp. NPDC057052 TaxID=3346010 RepID=UPI00362F56CA
MSGGNKKPDHYQAERQDAAQQNSTVDTVRNVAAAVSPFYSGGHVNFGKTSFEGYDLNEMIDIVESASPETLESAAKALVDARDAIKEAADELSRNLGAVDWEGEAHTAFYTWGTDLTTTAQALADYADQVGTQILAAGSGLASVRKSMPPRDTRTDRKTADDFPVPAQVDSNKDYAAAVKAEKDRQEAINQMYRLASFYTVSSGMMQLAEEPVFPKMPDVGVPVPPPGYEKPDDPNKRPYSLSPAIDPGATKSHHSEAIGIERLRTEELPSSHKIEGGSVAVPERHVGTEIDSVGTLPPQDTTKPTIVTPSSPTGPSGIPTGTPPPVVPARVPPILRGQAGRTKGFGGVPAGKFPNSAQGRIGGVPGGAGAGRTGTGPMGPVGRASTPGQAGGRGGVPTGRGVVGGVPKAVGQEAGRTGGVPRGPVNSMGAMNPGRPGSGRSAAGRTGDGVVGGRPVTGGAFGTNRSKLPRGTVVGGEGAPTSRAMGERPGQRGVIGKSGSTGAGSGQAARRPAAGTDGVVGEPKGRTPANRNGGNESGGPSVTRGVVRNQTSSKKRSRRDERRDDASSTG